MSTTWLTQDHLDALKRLLPYIEDRLVAQRVRELVQGLTADLTLRLSKEATALVMESPMPPLLSTDLDEVNTLVSKGVQHNGLVPELSVLQVGRALKVISALLGRAAAGTLDLEDQEGLNWIFDTAAAADEGVNRSEVRRVEQQVRSGLGLELRLHDYYPVNLNHPA